MARPAALPPSGPMVARRTTSAISRRLFADSRTRNVTFALLFAFMAYVQPVAYRHSYATLAERAEFARSFGGNASIRLFYGVPYDLLSVGGYTAWRVGGIVSIFAGVWGLLAAVRALRAEEDAGRQELVLAGVVTRRAALAAALAAILAGGALLWLAVLVGCVAGGLAVGDSAFLALAAVAPAAVFAGVGALASQLAPTRRVAVELSVAALGVALLVRIVADTASGLGWVRWLTPLGWSEEMRAFADPRAWVLVLPVVATALLAGLAGWISLRRDVGSGLLRLRDRSTPRLRLLSSPIAQALRDERGSLAAWLAGIGVFAVVIGTLSHSFTNENISSSLDEQLAKFGGASITTPSGALGFYFLFFVLATSLFAAAQIAALRREEAEQRLETLFALPVSRIGWLGGRLALAAAGATLLALAAGVLSWAGTATQGGGVSLADMIAAGANCLPATALFLALGALAFAAVPRAAAGIAYGLVAVAFVWELFGALLGAPTWTLKLSPFHAIGLVPAQPFDTVGAVVMVAIAAAATAGALAVFRRRDLAGS